MKLLALRIRIATCLFILSPLAFSTPNASISERQSLLGLSESSYFVIATESQSGSTYYSTFQRIVLKEYGLDTNELIQATPLFDSVLSIDTQTLERTVTPAGELPANTLNELYLKPVIFAAHPIKPRKKFRIDASGISVISDGKAISVLSAEELKRRISDIEAFLEYEETAPRVVALHSEPTSQRTRYLLVLRGGIPNSDSDSFEYVISLPEN